MQAMSEFGFVDQDLSEEFSYLEWHLGNEVGRRWWIYYRDFFDPDPEFARRVDEVINSGDPERNRNILDAMLPPVNEPE